MVLIPEEGSFTLTAHVESPGYIRVAPTGYIISERNGTWIAPLLPQMFYGASGTQLTTWRQYIPSAGPQIILSKPAGKLLIPREELYWRRIREPEKEAIEIVEPVRVTMGLGPAITILALLGLGGTLIYLSTR